MMTAWYIGTVLDINSCLERDDSLQKIHKRISKILLMLQPGLYLCLPPITARSPCRFSLGQYFQLRLQL